MSYKVLNRNFSGGPCRKLCLKEEEVQARQLEVQARQLVRENWLIFIKQPCK